MSTVIAGISPHGVGFITEEYFVAYPLQRRYPYPGNADILVGTGYRYPYRKSNLIAIELATCWRMHVFKLLYSIVLKILFLGALTAVGSDWQKKGNAKRFGFGFGHRLRATSRNRNHYPNRNRQKSVRIICRIL